jgi:hypothetical protein
VALLAGFGALLAGGYTAPYGPSHPRPENVIYALDAGARRAVWATAVDPPGEWLAQFVTESPKRGPLSNFQAVAGTATFSSAEAPVVDLPAPVVTLASSLDEGGGRLLSIRLASPRRARALSVRIPDREVLDTRVNGRPVGGGEGSQGWAAGRWGLEYATVPAEGVEVTVRVKGTHSVTVIVADRSDGLPTVPGVSFRPRPPASQPIHRGDMTLVQKAYVF